MPRMLRDAQGNLYGWNETMARLKEYTIVGDEDEAVPLSDPQAVGIGQTQVTDYVPGQPPPEPYISQEELIRQPPPDQREVQATPDAPAAKKGGKKSKTSSAASTRSPDDDDEGGGF